MSDIHRKRNDTVPVTGTLTENGDPHDLSQARKVEFHMSPEKSDTLKATGEAEVVDAAGGVVRYAFDASEVDESGYFEAEWEVEYADYTSFSFPSDGYLSVRITDDLNDA